MTDTVRLIIIIIIIVAQTVVDPAMMADVHFPVWNEHPPNDGYCTLYAYDS